MAEGIFAMNQGRLYALSNLVAGTPVIVSRDAWDWLISEGVVTHSGDVNRDALQRLVQKEFGETKWSMSARGCINA